MASVRNSRLIRRVMLCVLGACTLFSLVIVSNALTTVQHHTSNGSLAISNDSTKNEIQLQLSDTTSHSPDDTNKNTAYDKSQKSNSHEKLRFNPQHYNLRGKVASLTYENITRRSKGKNSQNSGRQLEERIEPQKSIRNRFGFIHGISQERNHRPTSAQYHPVIRVNRNNERFVKYSKEKHPHYPWGTHTFNIAEYSYSPLPTVRWKAYFYEDTIAVVLEDAQGAMKNCTLIEVV